MTVVEKLRQDSGKVFAEQLVCRYALSEPSLSLCANRLTPQRQVVEVYVFHSLGYTTTAFERLSVEEEPYRRTLGLRWLQAVVVQEDPIDLA